MADVKWIKILTDIFDDEKMLLIESMPEADSIIVIWFKLLCLAGKQNNSGVFMLNDKIAYTDEMLATIFRRPFSALGDVSDPGSNASRLVDFCRRYGLGGRVQDIGSFRNGEAPHVDADELDAQALEADRVRSLGELRAMVRC